MRRTFPLAIFKPIQTIRHVFTSLKPSHQVISYHLNVNSNCYIRSLYTIRKPIQPFRVIKRTIFINTETTPNPHSLKFLPGREVLPAAHGTGHFFQRGDHTEINRSPLAKSLFKIPEVKGIFFGNDFITVTKDVALNWIALKPLIFSIVLDFYAENQPIMLDSPMISDTTILDTDDEIVATIKELIESRVR